MRLFECSVCQQPLYFENTKCLNCESEVGYNPAEFAMVAVEESGLRRCANSVHGACNWLLEPDGDEELCAACRLNRTIPDLTVLENLSLWQRIEVAKHRLIYALLRLGLPIANKLDDEKDGLVFDFVREGAVDARPNPVVTTGHSNGVVTLNIQEADDAQREEHRQAMAEPYRTVLGHFRHEIGHYYWDRLIRDSPAVLADFRKLFGDERQDYAAAQQRHYGDGAPGDWSERYISAYASMHPWEDWAETWAHTLHMLDTLETADAFGVRTRPRVAQREALEAKATFDPYREASFDRILGTWLPLTFALNSLNRSMGFRDLYPFVYSPPVVEKLRFVHAFLTEGTRKSANRKSTT